MVSFELAPSAPFLLESMRAIGYSPQTAIADLVDNSVTANATRVYLRFPPGPPSFVALLDDGDGMTESELEAAMRHGSRHPSEMRPANDLGRFGLGLKTASMSQCRELTVVSIKNGLASALCWDLDVVATTNAWTVIRLSPFEIEQLPHFADLKNFGKGTMVLWRKLDRLAAGDVGTGAVLGERIALVTEHLSSVFHRFLSGDARKPALRIAINGNFLPARDPFLVDSGSEKGPEEVIDLDGHKITVQAYTLPHIARLSREQVERAGGDHGLRRNQGFYVYRNKRLIVSGTWFRLHHQEELAKLTRVRVDVPNSLDHLWTLDVKKSDAAPPAIVRDRLRQLMPRFVGRSKDVLSWSGRVRPPAGVKPMWNRIEQNGGVRYEVNFDNPLVRSVLDRSEGSQAELTGLLRAISASLPLEGIYNDRASERMGHKLGREAQEELAATLEESLRGMLATFPEGSENRAGLLAALPGIEPFARYQEITSKIIERITR